MGEVGRKFEAQQFYVPGMLVAARAMKSGLSVLRPHLIRTGIKSVSAVVMDTIKGDLRDIGKNLVAMMLEETGFEVVDLGADVSRDVFHYGSGGTSTVFPDNECVIDHDHVSDA